MNAARTFRRLVGPGLVVAVWMSLLPTATGAHGPDPVFSGSLYADDTTLKYDWKSGQVPPATSMQPAINDAAADANATRASKAAKFAQGTSSSKIAYGEPTNCGPQGIACFSRAGAPSTFQMWFRANGKVLFNGDGSSFTVRWCQITGGTNCWDVENIALDEFGHVEILNHHANLADLSDYTQAVVQARSRQGDESPNAGWNAHAFARCDVASLQTAYGIHSTDKISLCLPDRATVLTLSVNDSSIAYNTPVTFTATLKVSSNDSVFPNQVLAGRTVDLYFRAVGGTTWTRLTTFAASGDNYVRSLSLTQTRDWMARFGYPSEPTDESLNADNSGIVRVTVASCSIPPCPLSVPER